MGEVTCHYCGLQGLHADDCHFNTMSYNKEYWRYGRWSGPIKSGWQCPVCGRGLAYWVAVCPCYKDDVVAKMPDELDVTVKGQWAFTSGSIFLDLLETDD